MIDSDLGRWHEVALCQFPQEDRHWAGFAKRGFVLIADTNKVIATIRRTGQQWLARVNGFEWKITTDMPAARFLEIPSSSVVTHTPVKAFPTSAKAIKEIDQIIKAKPDISEKQA